MCVLDNNVSELDSLITQIYIIIFGFLCADKCLEIEIYYNIISDVKLSNIIHNVAFYISYVTILNIYCGG